MYFKPDNFKPDYFKSSFSSERHRNTCPQKVGFERFPKRWALVGRGVLSLEHAQDWTVCNPQDCNAPRCASATVQLGCHHVSHQHSNQLANPLNFSTLLWTRIRIHGLSSRQPEATELSLNSTPRSSLWKSKQVFDGFIIYLSTHSLQRQNVLYGLHAQSKEVRSGVFKIF